MTIPLSEPDYDRQHAEAPAGPVCSRCGKRAALSAPAEPDVGLFGDLWGCPTDGEFYEDREGFTIRQVFLDDSAPVDRGTFFPAATQILNGDGIVAAPDGLAIAWLDQSGNENHMRWEPGKGPLVVLACGQVALSHAVPVEVATELDGEVEF